LLLFCLIFLTGFFWSLIGISSTLITKTGYLGFSYFTYGLLIFIFSVGGILAALWLKFYAGKKGLNIPFNIGILCCCLSTYLLGMIDLIFLIPFLSLMILAMAFFLMGVGFALLISLITLLVLHHFRTSSTATLVLFYAVAAAAALCFSLFMRFNKFENTIIIPIFLVVGYIIIFLLISSSELLTSYPLIDKKPGVKIGSLFYSCMIIGLLETLFFNWTKFYLIEQEKLIEVEANSIFLLFLLFYSLGRLTFGVSLFWFRERIAYWLLPALGIVFITFFLTFFDIVNQYVLFASIGFIYSGLLPLTLGCSQLFFPDQQTFVIPKLFMGYLTGDGAGAFLYGLLVSFNSHLFTYFVPLIVILTFGLLICNLLSLRSHSSTLNKK
jgi:hypothetical protein